MRSSRNVLNLLTFCIPVIAFTGPAFGADFTSSSSGIISNTGQTNINLCADVLSLIEKTSILPHTRVDSRFELQPHFISLIENSSEVQNLRADLSRLSLSPVSFMIKEFGGMDYTPESGEEVQAWTLIKILRQILPSAEFYAGLSLVNLPVNNLDFIVRLQALYNQTMDAKPHQVSFSLFDSAELGRPFVPKEQPSTFVEMIDIKPVAMKTQSLSHSQYRQKLNVPSSVRLAHLYDRFTESPLGKMRNSNTHPGLSDIVKKINKFDFYSVILTPRGGAATKSRLKIASIYKAFPEVGEYFDQIYSLRDLIEGRAKPNWEDRNLILNDTFGRMEEIHGASDLSVIVGPINFFEPLALGTPTILMASQKALYGYSPQGLRQLVSAASGYHHFIHLENWDDFTQLPEASDVSNIQAVQDGNLNRLITILVRKIRQQLGAM